MAPSVQRCKVSLTPTTRAPCINPSKLAGVLQTRQQISAVSGPKFTILWGHVEEISLFNDFFSIVSMCLSCEDMARQSCNVFSGTLNPTHFTSLVRRWRIFASFLRLVFSASSVQHISNLHSKCALRPHHVWKYGRHPISDR